jgi:hypothetical protein
VSEEIWAGRKGIAGNQAPPGKSLKSHEDIWTPFGKVPPNPDLDLAQPAPYARKSRVPFEEEPAQVAVEDLERGKAEPAAKLRKRLPGVKLPKPAEPEDKPRRLGRSIYDAVQTHGHFGMVDGGETNMAGVRRVIVHVPKRNRGYVLDIKPGEVIYANSAKGKPVRGLLNVVYVTRNKYTPPGHAVSSCVVGIAEHEWERFMD